MTIESSEQMDPIDPATLTFHGAGLNRPECVLCTAAGDLYTADWRGGVARVRPDGTVTLFTGTSADLQGGRLLPNGIALEPDGSFLLAHLGPDEGGVFRLRRDGRVEPVLREADGVALPPTNFVLLDRAGRLWITVSTRRRPRHRAFRGDAADGFVVLLDDGGARIVADGLGYTNEVAVHPSGDWLYVNETFGRRLTRFRLAPDGSLRGRETVAAFGPGTFPDGLAFDAEGGAWITSVVSNRVIRVAPDGGQTVLIEDADPAHLARCEAAYVAGRFDRSHLDASRGRHLLNLSSLAFGGPDLRDAFLGCLQGDRVARFRAPVAGLAPAHWRFRAAPPA